MEEIEEGETMRTRGIPVTTPTSRSPSNNNSLRGNHRVRTHVARPPNAVDSRGELEDGLRLARCEFCDQGGILNGGGRLAIFLDAARVQRDEEVHALGEHLLCERRPRTLSRQTPLE